MSEQTKRVVVEIDETLKDRFKKKVDSEGATMRYYLLKWIKEYTYDKKDVR